MNARNNAALNESRAQENFGTNLSNIQTGMGSQLSGVPVAPIAVPNYSGGIQNAFNSAALGAEVFGRNDGGAPVDTSKGIPNPNYQNPNASTWGGNMGNSFYIN